MAVAVSASGSVSNSFGLVLNILKLFQLEVLLNTKTTWPCLGQVVFFFILLQHTDAQCNILLQDHPEA